MAFGPETTAEEVVAGKDLSGRTFVVTGSSAGLGAETARVLAKASATVVMVARNADKNAKVMADPELLERWTATIPIKRAGNPEEVAAVILYLASDDAQYVVGAAFAVDGGQTAG